MIPASYVQIAARSIAIFEGCERRIAGTNQVVPYPDPAHGWKVPTIGFGEVCKSTDGPYTIEECWLRLYARIASEYGKPVWEECEPARRSEWIFAACTSFTWNLGVTAFKSSGMLRALNRGEWQAAAANCRLWCLAGNQPLAGLKRRRGIEANMLLAGSRAL